MSDMNMKRETNTNHFLCSYKIQKRMSTVSGFDETQNMRTGKSVKLHPQNPFDTNLKEGQIRLLSQLDRITYVVLLRRWEEDAFVVMTFSHYDFPATDEEIKHEFDGGMYLNTLQAWNTRTLLDETLKKSWLIGELPASDCSDAWDFWEHLMTGRDLKAELLEKTGLPITSADDPRIQYMKEELAAFDQLDDAELTKNRIPPSGLTGLNCHRCGRRKKSHSRPGMKGRISLPNVRHTVTMSSFPSYSLREKKPCVSISIPQTRAMSPTPSIRGSLFPKFVLFCLRFTMAFASFAILKPLMGNAH